MSLSALVIIPTYNERANIPVLIAGLMKHDERARARRGRQLARRHGRARRGTRRASINGRVSVLHRTTNRGFGRSYIDGMKRALGEAVDVVCQMDADLSHDPRAAARPARGDRHGRHGDRFALRARRHHRELAVQASRPQPLREHLRPHGDPARRARLHVGLSMLATRRSPRCRSTLSSRTATRSWSRCSSSRTGAAAASPRCRSPSSSAARASRRCRARCCMESAFTPWRLVANPESSRKARAHAVTDDYRAFYRGPARDDHRRPRLHRQQPRAPAGRSRR